MQSSSRKIGFVALLLTLASGTCLAAPPASVSGVVRNARGAVQIGAIVEVFASDSVNAATAVTDLYGRYHIANLVPGRYEVRASAPLFVSAARGNLRLLTGARATVNLTLTMLSDPAAWLPGERRGPDESGDDWRWTLRSAANRPILRVLDDGQVVLVSSGKAENPRSAAGTSVRARASVTGGETGFGGGSLQSVISVDQALGDSAEMVLRTGLTSLDPALNVGQATEVDAGYQRHAGLTRASRVVASYESHPEIASAGGVSGLQIMGLTTAQRMKFGDSIDVEAGGTIYAIHMVGDTVSSQPFLRVSLHPGEVWAMQYSMASGNGLQSFDGLDSIHAAMPVAAVVNGLLRTAGGVHHEVGLTRRIGKGVVEAAVYHDNIHRSSISGAGVLSATDLARGCGSSALVGDAATASFRFLAAGYDANGTRFSVSQPLASDVLATLEYRNGAALAVPDTAGRTPLALSPGFRAQTAQAASAAVQARLAGKGTRLRVAYRWQPQHLLTPVAPYAALSDQAFLGFHLDQSLHWGSKLPPGLEARVDVNNLLAQGYRPFLSADGRTLFLAQSPRTLQAGIAFTF